MSDTTPYFGSGRRKISITTAVVSVTLRPSVAVAVALGPSVAVAIDSALEPFGTVAVVAAVLVVLIVPHVLGTDVGSAVSALADAGIPFEDPY
ncbi:hypothetical protein [Natrarchaeobius oligotrophus]|uniref:hypothetical protein n=1 Tax=Natrarchaeobius oligotrophus TaxID=3455743 RepID=UPI000F52F257|nr:hypothetical protein [Natrarchaeobius chitinivorans]